MIHWDMTVYKIAYAPSKDISACTSGRCDQSVRVKKDPKLPHVHIHAVWSESSLGALRFCRFFFYAPAHLLTFPDIDGQCGGILTNTTNSIVAPDRDGDGQYDNNLNCLWAIIAPRDHVIELEFRDLDLEETDTCDFDVIEASICTPRKRSRPTRKGFSYEPHHEKTCLCPLRTTKVQISLPIRAVWSAPLLFAA